MIPAVTVASDRRATSAVGRQARLHLAFDVRDQHTVLASSYAEPPFRVPRGFADCTSGLHAILASSAPGIFGGDCFTQTVDVAPGARVRLTSQSAQQIHPARDGQTAAVASRYTIGAGSHLHCAWDPSIPFAGARLDQRIHIDLAASASLFWSDAIMAGRQACGERWAFARLAHELRIARHSRLIYLERYALDGGDASTTYPWIAGDACYFGSVLVVGPSGLSDRWSAATLHEDVGQSAAVRAAVDRLEEDVLLVRLSSASGPAFHAARTALLNVFTV